MSSVAATTPLASIIIPVRDFAAGIGGAIESALRQTHPRIEVIVIDDGSTDGSGQVARSFGDRVRVEESYGIGAAGARNRGIEIARGDWVQFLDADDLLFPEKIARHLALDLDADEIGFADHEEEGPSGRRIRRATLATDDPVAFAAVKIPLISAPLHRATWIRRIGAFDPALTCALDYDLLLRLAIEGCRFRRIPEPLWIRRLRPTSLSSDSVRVMAVMREVRRRAVESLKAQNAFTTARGAVFAGCLASAARHHLRGGRYAEAESCFAEAKDLHRNGGLSVAYGPMTLRVRRLLGPRMAERLATLGRRTARSLRS